MALLPDTIAVGPFDLRRWRTDDAAALFAAVCASRAELRPWMPWAEAEPTMEDTLAVLTRFAADFEAGETFAYGLFEGAAVVGGAGLHRRGGPGAVEIGYWVHTGRRRRGYATAAARALTTAAFTFAGAERVYIRVADGNVASAGVPTKLGYRPDGAVQLDPPPSGHDGQGRRWVMERRLWA